MKLVQRVFVATIAAAAVVISTSTLAGAELDPAATSIDSAQFNNGEGASISSDGRFIAYSSGNTEGIELFDSADGSVTRVSANGFDPAISGDGAWIAYSEIITDEFEILLWSRSTGTTQMLSDGSRITTKPRISFDGSVVVWNDNPRDTGTRMVRIWRRSTGQIENLERAFGLALLSADGRYLFYVNRDNDSIRRDLTNGTERRLAHFVDDVSDDGDHYLYVPFVPNVVLGGVARHTISTGAESVLAFTDDFGIGPQGVQLSGDGSTVFVNARPDLVASDANDSFDLYRWRPDVDQLHWTTGFANDVAQDVSFEGNVVVTRGQGLRQPSETGNNLTRLDYGSVVLPLPTPDPVAVADLARPQLTDQVNRLYRAFFLRPPDQGGLAFWRDQRVNGATAADIAERFAQSPEFIDRYGQLTNSQFVELIYQNLFERQPDTSGGPFWTAQLDNGTPRGDVMAAFSESPEFVMETSTSSPSPAAAHQIWRLYRAYFERNADQGGFDFWYRQAFNGRSLADISDEFARSEEFTASYGDLSDGAFIDLVYDNILGRTPDAGGRQFWLDQIAAGTSRGSVMLAFSESPEYITKTDTLPA